MGRHQGRLERDWVWTSAQGLNSGSAAGQRSPLYTYPLLKTGIMVVGHIMGPPHCELPPLASQHFAQQHMCEL